MRVSLTHLMHSYLGLLLLGGVACQWTLIAAQAATFNVRDFGAIGDGKHDDEVAIQRTVSAAIKNGSGNRIFLPAGTYLLADKMRRGPDQINIQNARDLTFTGEKGTVLLTDAPTVTVVGIFGSSNITLSQLIIRRKHNVFSRVKVVGVDIAAHTTLVEVAPNNPALDDDLVVNAKFLLIEGESGPSSWGDHKADCGWFDERDHSVCWPPSILSRTPLPKGRWLLHLNTTPMTDDIGKTAYVWGGNYKSHAFSIARTNDVLVEDIVYYPGGTDGGFVLADNTGNITFRRFVLDTPPESGDLIAAIGGSMAINNHIVLTLDSVKIVHVWDDAVNIGTDGVRIYAHPSPRVLDVDAVYAKDFRPGDTLAVWDWKNRRERGHAKIVTVSMTSSNPPTCEVLLDQSVSTGRIGYTPNAKAGQNVEAMDLVFDLNSTGSLHAVNSIFQSLHARDIVLRASHSVIENCTFRDTVMAGILIAPEAVWDEGPGIEDVLIKNNTFVNVSGSNILSSYGAEDEAPYSSRISVIGNRFLSYGRYAHGTQGDQDVPVLLRDVSTGEVSNNHFVPFSSPQKCERPVSWFCLGAKLAQVTSQMIHL
jgi:hypothetical protein